MILSAVLSPVWVLNGHRMTLREESFFIKLFSWVCKLHSVNSVLRSSGRRDAWCAGSSVDSLGLSTARCLSFSFCSLKSRSFFFWRTYVNSFRISSSSYSSKMSIWSSMSSLSHEWSSTSCAVALSLGTFWSIIFMTSIASFETVSLYSMSWFSCSTVLRSPI